MEALWVSRELHPGKAVLASEQAHYTHSRISGVLGIDFESVPCDPFARMDVEALEARLANGGVGTVVATIGTTATGSIDPLPEILKLKEVYGFRLHADAAYGGYFTLVDNLDPEVRAAYDLLSEVDSLVIDPHKHGLQPYGCGCILFRDPEVGKFYMHDSPYTCFTSPELHLGEISLECSRAGAAAVGLWATQKMLPLERGGEFAGRLAAGREAALALYEKVAADERFRTIFRPTLDILVWAPVGTSASQISRRTGAIFEAAAAQNLHLAIYKCPVSLLDKHWEGVDFDQDSVSCLRSCLMKPEQVHWVDQIWDLLDGIVEKVLAA
jgi:glutamate/tyrosine decarboxylase-like PLP-dependent enzyme